MVDVVLALVLTVVTAPLLLLAVVLVRFSSAGPVIYSQTRMGKGRRLFTIFKVRTMHHDCERHTGPQWSTENDPRVFAVGHFLRRSHLDELPQLWNVLRGEMSLVGPRPERPELLENLALAIPFFEERMRNVKPGITGLAQVRGLRGATESRGHLEARVAADLEYINTWSLWLDVRILVQTLRVIVHRNAF